MRKALLASVSAVVLSSSAYAKAPPPPPPMSWVGFYIGANAGYAWAKSNPSFIGDVSGAPFFLFSNGTNGSPPSLNPRGFIGGGQVGYNWQMGQWVYGVEADFSGLSAKNEATVSPFFTGKSLPNTLSWSSHYDWLFTARVRGGMTIAPNWLLYVTGGFALTQVSDSVTCMGTSFACGNSSGTAPFMTTWSQSSTLAGGTFGGGTEWMFSPNWTARVEYLYAKFQNNTPSSSAPAGIPALFSFSHDLNLVRFAVNYKF
jgi:outer membrane immunogenic protein